MPRGKQGADRRGQAEFAVVGDEGRGQFGVSAVHEVQVQGVVGEVVGEALLRLCAGQAVGAGEVVQGGQAVKPRQAVQSAPDALFGAARKPRRVLCVAHQQEVSVFLRFGGARFFARQFVGARALAGDAVGGERAGGAVGFVARTKACTEIHQSLGVGAQFVRAFGQAAFGKLPQAFLGGGRGRVGVDGGMAQEDAFDVAVEDGFARAIGKDGYRCGGRASYAFQGFEFGAGVRECAVVLVADLFGGVVEVAGAAVVAQSAPQRHDAVGGGVGEGADGGVSGKEALVVGDDGGDLGLLEHDFREPDAVGVVALPGQVVAAMLFLPVYQARGEGIGHGVARVLLMGLCWAVLWLFFTATSACWW